MSVAPHPASWVQILDECMRVCVCVYVGVLFAFRFTLKPLEKAWTGIFFPSYGWNSWTHWVLWPCLGSSSRRKKKEFKPIVLRLYKNLFLRKKSSWPRATLDLAWVEKGEIIPDRATPKSYLPLFVENYYWTLSTNSGTEQQAGKNSQQMGFVTRFLNGTSQEMKPKSNESTNLGTKLKTPILKPPERFHHSLLWRCPWCNSYRRRKWTRRHEFKSWTRLIAFHIALMPLGKVWIQLFSLQLWVNSRTAFVLQLWWGN